MNYSIKSDIWAIGCLFYEIITGEYLFDIDNSNNKLDKDIDHIYNIVNTFNNHSEFLETIKGCDYYDNFFIDNKLKIKNKYDILSFSVKLLQYSKIKNDLNETYKFLNLFFIYNITLRPNTYILLKHNYLMY